MLAKDINKTSIGWCLYDFANSITVAIGGIYFSKWYIEDIGAGSVSFNIIFLTSAFIIILLGKWIGRRIDKDGYKYWILISSVIVFLANILIFFASQLPITNIIVPLSFILFIFYLFNYQISRICHNTYLRTVFPEKLQSKLSGYGAASNWAGSLFGIALTIPVVTIYPGTYGREITFLIAALGYGLFATISLVLMLGYAGRSSSSNIDASSFNRSKLSWNTILKKYGTILFVYFLLFDVMSSVQRNLPPFLTSVHGMSDDIQAYGFLSILVSAMLGGIIAAKWVSFSNSKTYLRIFSLGLALSVALVTIQHSITVWVTFVIAGICYGVLESTIRVNFMNSFQAHRAGENFGILAAVERTTGIAGPILWIIPFTLLSSEQSSYISSMLLLASLSAFAFVLLFKEKAS